MLDGHPPPEPALEAEDHLRRQADLRHQHQRSAAQRKRALDQTQEYDGLAAAGHAMQKRRMGLVILKAGQQLLKHLLLLCGKGERLRVKGDCSKQIKGLVLLGGRQNSFLTRPSSVAREIPTSSSCRAVRGPFFSASTAASWRGPGFGFSGNAPASV